MSRRGSLGRVAGREDVRTVAGTPTGTPQTNGGALWIFDSTNNLMYGWSGTAWQQVGPLGAWTTWAPSYTAITVGNGTETARYTRVGRTIIARWELVLGSTSTIGTDAAVSVPVAASATGAYTVGSAWYYDSSASTDYVGTCVQGRASGKVLFVYAPGARLASTLPFTWATGDAISCQFTYEAAA